MNKVLYPMSVPASGELVLTNARVVTAEAEFDGTVVLRGDEIVEVSDRPSGLSGAVDFEGDHLLPGLVELHTDNLERHVSPRPGVTWPPAHAILAHDAEVAAAGITTVLDALRLGTLRESGDFVRGARDLAGTINALQADGLTRAEHLLHLRCEVSCDGVAGDLGRFIGDPLLRLVSVMDHTPGQRQFADLEKYKEYYGGKYGFTDEELQRYLDQALAAQARNSAPNRRRIVELCALNGISLASHDDACREHVEEALDDGVVIAEFPTTEEAAAAAGKAGLHILMGAPNVMRGGSHSGNVSALELAQNGRLDILSSDYVPASLLQSAFRLAEQVGGIALPAAIATVSRNPARAVGLDDRGEIAVGQRADLLRVRRTPQAAVVREVWRAGRRVG
ncbi:MAG TPA: alpha-D-ribose 1-methylphosphonate 5-triphosphate diphosphatase [Alphaproteobacteria bacterium]|nr:alpha-D-ribose 1-methylphosphonate 5-triphosphate diphosphatase [Alphaproteobacteria bacterium]